MTNDAQYTNFADFLSDLSVAVAVALKKEDAATVQELAGHLAELVEAAGESNEPELAAYWDVLAGPLHGEDVTLRCAGHPRPHSAQHSRRPDTGEA